MWTLDIVMFLKPANSNTENGIKKIQKCPLKKSYTAETGKPPFERYQNNTVIRQECKFFLRACFK